MAHPITSMSDTATTTEEPALPVRDLESAAQYFQKSEASAPTNDSAAAAAAPEGETTDEPVAPDNTTTETDPTKEGEQPEAKAEDALTPEEAKQLPTWAHKRMGEISEKKNLLTTEVETLKADVQTKDQRIAELEQQVAGKAPVVVAATPDSPLANIEDPQQLERELSNALDIREWAQRNPEGGTIDLGGGNTREVSAEEVKEALANTDRMINQHIPARMRFLEQRGTYVAAARTDYPDLFKAGTEDHATYQQLLGHWPEIKRFLDPEIIAGRYIRGLKAEQAEKAAAKKTGTVPVPPVKKPATTIAPSAVRTSAPGMPSGEVKNDAAKVEAKKQATSSGSLDAAARYFDS